jgi:general stress protein 26
VIPSVDRLAALLQRADCAMLTVIDADGRPRTRPITPLKVPFNGHLWLRLDGDGQLADQIGRGTEVSLAYAPDAGGPYVTVYGRAIVLRDPPSSGALRTQDCPQRVPRPSAALICVTARAAEMWDEAATASRRVFAFSSAHPVSGDAGLRSQAREPMPRIGLRLAASCAQ